MCDLLLEKLATAEAEVAQLVPAPSQAGGRGGGGPSSAASTRSPPYLHLPCSLWPGICSLQEATASESLRSKHCNALCL